MSVLLGTKPLVDSIRHFIRDPNGVFSVCHLCECRIVQKWRHDSRLLLKLLNWFLHIKKEDYTLARRYEFYVLVARTVSHSFASLTREILFLPLEHKIHIFSPPCNILYILCNREAHVTSDFLTCYNYRRKENEWLQEEAQQTRLESVSHILSMQLSWQFQDPNVIAYLFEDVIICSKSLALLRLGEKWTVKLWNLHTPLQT